VDLACSSTDKAVEASDIALQNAQTTASNAYTADASLAFGEQQNVLNGLNAKFSYMAANPMGYTPSELASATTSINENTSNAAKQAIGAAAAFGASHGAADVGGGAMGEIAGQIGSEAAQSKAQELSALSVANQQMKTQNMWKGLSGLSGVGSEFGGALGTTSGAGNAAANSAVGAGTGAVGASTAAAEETGGLISGIGGLAMAGAGMIPGGSGGASEKTLAICLTLRQVDKISRHVA